MFHDFFFFFFFINKISLHISKAFLEVLKLLYCVHAMKKKCYSTKQVLTKQLWICFSYRGNVHESNYFLLWLAFNNININHTDKILNETSPLDLCLKNSFVMKFFSCYCHLISTRREKLNILSTMMVVFFNMLSSFRS